jgi:hypothetical protein
MVVDLDHRRAQADQVLRADGVVDADEVADAKRGKGGGRANRVKQPAARVDGVGKRGQAIVELAPGDGVEQRRVPLEDHRRRMPRGSLAHDSEGWPGRRTDPHGSASSSGCTTSPDVASRATRASRRRRSSRTCR